MIAGVGLGIFLPDLTDTLRRLELGEDSQINVPIAVLIGLMITPMMMKVDFAAVKKVGKKPRGFQWFEQKLLPATAPVGMSALMATLVLIFAFQADNILTKSLHVLLIAVPILIQVYFNSSLTYGLMKLFKVS